MFPLICPLSQLFIGILRLNQIFFLFFFAFYRFLQELFFLGDKIMPFSFIYSNLTTFFRKLNFLTNIKKQVILSASENLFILMDISSRIPDDLMYEGGSTYK